MYGKHFAQTYTGSMYGAGPVVFAVWGYIIANTRKDGTVELNSQMLSATLGCDAKAVNDALAVLTGPDPKSRSKEHDGRRLLPLGEYLFQVPSYKRFNSMRNDEERRAYNRLKQRESRKRRVKSPVNALSSGVNSRQPRSAHIPVNSVPVPVTLLPATTLSSVPARRNGARSYAMIRDSLAGMLAEVEAGTGSRLNAETVREVQVDLIFAYWQAKLHHESAMLDVKRVNLLKARLAENEGNVHELLFVVDGTLKDKHRMGQNDRNRKFDGVESIYLDRATVERLSGQGGYKPGAVHPMAEKYLDLVRLP